MAKRLTTITAGRLVVVGCYTIPTPRRTERERKALRDSFYNFIYHIYVI